LGAAPPGEGVVEQTGASVASEDCGARGRLPPPYSLDRFFIICRAMAKSRIIPLTVLFTVLRLSEYFGNSVEFWIGIQNDYEIRRERDLLEKELVKIKRMEKITA
jgi:hypothetical protein